MPKLALHMLLLVMAAMPLAHAQNAECEPGKLSDYEKLAADGCMIGKYRFANFRYQRGADGLPSKAISVTLGVSPGGDDPGLYIEGRWKAPARQPSTISYTVELPPSGKAIAGATLQMQFGQIVGTGEAKVVTEVCPIDTPDHCGPAGFDLQVLVSAGAERKASDDGQLRTAMHQIAVTHVLDLVTGKNGAATFNGFMMLFHLEPAPSLAPATSKP